MYVEDEDDPAFRWVVSDGRWKETFHLTTRVPQFIVPLKRGWKRKLYFPESAVPSSCTPENVNLSQKKCASCIESLIRHGSGFELITD
jgi:hypothetical protein